jgi:hypothetical protein
MAKEETNKTLIFGLRVALARFLVGRVSRECPSWRQTNLHIAALDREVTKFNERFWDIEAAKVLGGGEASKSRMKAMGSALKEINKKSGQLKSSLSDLFVQSACRNDPRLTPRQARRQVVIPVERLLDNMLTGVIADRKAIVALQNTTEPARLRK